MLVIDNYDSFTYNLVQYLGELGENPLVRRNDAITVAEVEHMAPSAIVISPGPCTPAEAGVSVPLIRHLGARVPILGVCLGHQSIGAAYGARVVPASHVMHGKTSQVSHDGSGIFRSLPSPLTVMRYHSLIVERDSLPQCLRVTAISDDEVHALEHMEHPVWGVQFHPESIMTQHGRDILANFLSLADDFRHRQRAV
ncbi:MAG: Aminodeoxychorismate synthase component 2 [Gemmatimonadaceae bacterium]|nr:Aminodeoxychorismate synthase component 2 [Gemmatimonadaceae bacterium]